MKSFRELQRNLKRDASGMAKVRLAVLADSSSQHFVQAIRGAAFDRHIALEVFEAPYSQIDAQILDPTSELHAFQPEFTLIWHAGERLLERFQTTPLRERAQFAEQKIAHVADLVTALTERMATTVLYLNVAEFDDGVFGSYANKVAHSWPFQLRRFNYRLMELASERADLFIVDLAMVAADFGRSFAHDRRVAAMTELLFSFDFLPVMVDRVLDVVDARRGRIRKCLILDLDNTLWGGVIGDDGVENIELGALGAGHVFDELQSWARALKERGVLLAVCSKNDERIASEPFIRHPDMTLRLEDIAVFVANWENKADNIRHIQSILDIGFDSMVFVDDNPAERAIVRMELPDVIVPELPDDPADWLPALRRMNLFETTGFTEQDAQRTEQYRVEASRRSLRANFSDEKEFLRSLEMVGSVEGFTSYNLPRVAQLTQRSNQFNLRTVRYDEAELLALTQSPRHLCFAFSLNDKFGHHGLISVVILEERGDGFFVDTWLMSCRVLKRGVEQHVLNTIADAVRDRGGVAIIGEYLPTAKNGLVKDHFESLGFVAHNGLWRLDLSAFMPSEPFIRTHTFA